MCQHNNVEHITPKGIRPLFADNLSMEFWECKDCGALLNENPQKKSDDYEEVNEMSEVRKTLFKQERK